MTESYVELEISADSALNEQVVAILSQLGFEGFWEDDIVLRCYMRGSRWNDQMQREVECIMKTIHRSSNSALPKISARIIEQQNWNEEWEKTIQPIHATDHIVITPTWHKYQAQGDEIVLTIDPKMSFGTGYHETTRLTLKLMERHLRRGMKVLDVGTGTGVLAIAAITLGASFAVGVDNDEWSFNNAVENLSLNEVADNVKILHGELHEVEEFGFDMIVANIQRNVIEPLLSEMKGKLNGSGILILSGLLSTDEQRMKEAFSDRGLWISETLSENEWRTYCVRQESHSL